METLWKPDGNLDGAGSMNGDGDNRAGERFKCWRALNGASQRRLGDMPGISHTSVGKIEGGKQPPKADIIARFEALEREEETPESSDLTLVVPVSDDAQSDRASAAHDAASHDTPDGVARAGRLTVNPRADYSDPEVNPCAERPSSEVNTLADAVSHDAQEGDAPEDVARADYAVHTPLHGDVAVRSVALESCAPDGLAHAGDAVHAPVHAIFQSWKPNGTPLETSIVQAIRCACNSSMKPIGLPLSTEWKPCGNQMETLMALVL